jgi:hypothetical protein
MAYYYDWIDRQWKPSKERMKCVRVWSQHRPRMLKDLFREIEKRKGGPTATYAMLLARALVQDDEELMREFGKQVVEVTEGQPAVSKDAA